MKRVVQDFVCSCQVCQQNKVEQLQQAGLLQHLEVPSHIWDISINFIEGLSRVNGKSVILTIVDRFSKFAHFVPLAHRYTAGVVARVFSMRWYGYMSSRAPLLVIMIHSSPATSRSYSTSLVSSFT